MDSKNIEHFGGDKDNVTICGLSSGSGAVPQLLRDMTIFLKMRFVKVWTRWWASLDKANKWGELFLQSFLEQGLSIKDLMNCSRKNN